jgi:hypothetical protein
MQPRQTLLDSARNEARSLSNKLKYDFFDRLEDGSLHIAASGERKNRPAAGGLNAFCMASWSVAAATIIANSSPVQRPERRVIVVASDFLKVQLGPGLDQQLRTRTV